MGKNSSQMPRGSVAVSSLQHLSLAPHWCLDRLLSLTGCNLPLSCRVVGIHLLCPNAGEVMQVRPGLQGGS
jgi:hypothetical protein